MDEVGLPQADNQAKMVRHQLADESRVSQKESQIDLPKAFQGSEYARMRDSVREEGRPFGVLFTDIDNTFYRPDRSSDSVDLKQLADQNEIPIVAITGVSYEIILDRINKGELPYFSVIAGAVGTEIWVLHIDDNGNNTYVKDDEFDLKIVFSGFDRGKLTPEAGKMIADVKSSKPSWNLDFQQPEVEAAYLAGQEAPVQPYKISFYAMADSEASVAEIEAEVSSRFPAQKVVICEEIGYNGGLASGEIPKKYCIDILPITKADTVSYVREKTGVDISAVAGDSGNDKQMLTGAGDIAIQVGGAKPELVSAIDQEAQKGRGAFSFRKVVMPDGSKKLYYREQALRLGPESIIRAGQILARAQARFGNKST